jgi:phosphoglycolate phosphatase
MVSCMICRAVLFDLDGTLLDTLQDLADSSNLVLRQLGFPEHPIASYKRFVGDGIAELARRVLPEGNRDEATLAHCLSAIRSEYNRRWADQTRPYEGIPDLLDALTARCLPLAILSNKPHEMTAVVVERFLSRWRFAVVLGAKTSVPMKPDPTAALDIAQRLVVQPGQILFLGDTGTDMRTARAAGMVAVGVLWGFRTADELRENGATRLLENPLELLELL